MTYPAVAATDLVIHQLRYAKDWRIYSGWLAFVVAWNNNPGATLDAWGKWLSIGFGSSAAARYGHGISADEVSVVVAAFPYTGHACFRVCEFSLLFCCIFLFWNFTQSQTDYKRALVAFLLAYYISAVSLVQLALVGRDYRHGTDINYLLRPYPVWIYNEEDTLGTISPDAKIEFGAINIMSVAILLVSCAALWRLGLRNRTKRLLPRSVIRKLKVFTADLSNLSKQNIWMIVATSILALINLTARILIRAASVGITAAVFDEPVARIFPIGVKAIGPPGISLAFTYFEDTSKTWVPITSCKVTDLDQMLAVIAGALAVLLSLKDVLEKKGIMTGIRASVARFRGVEEPKYGPYNLTTELNEFYPADLAVDQSNLPRARLKKLRIQHFAQNF